MKNILAAIFFQLNPLSFPIAILILLGVKGAVGKEVDPAYRAPKDKDAEYITWIENYVANGQPLADASQYRVYCGYLGVPVKAPFGASHPLSKVTIL